MTHRFPYPLLGIAVVMAAMSGTPCISRAQVVPQDIHAIDARLDAVQGELDSAKKRLARTEQLYKGGQTNQAEVEDAQAKVDSLARQVQAMRGERGAAEARLAFRRPVTLQLDHASVRQFAAVLAKATGIPVKVDAAVPNDATTMLTMDAQAVPFADVLEAIAQKTDLMIAPADQGVVLKQWPHLNDRVMRTPTAPWSADWVVPPTIRAAGFAGNPTGFNPGSPQGAFPGQSPQSANPFEGANPFGGQGAPVAGRPGGGGFGPPQGVPGAAPGFGNPGQFGPGPMPGQGFPGGMPGQGFPGGMNGMPGMQPGLPFSMTNIGDHLIAIAEPGAGPRGEPGIWLTAYMFDGNGFHRMGQGFHPFTNRGPGMPDGRNGNPAGRPPQGNQRPGSPGPGLRPSAPGAVPNGSSRAPDAPGELTPGAVPAAAGTPSGR
jgi:hypothetical protein